MSTTLERLPTTPTLGRLLTGLDALADDPAGLAPDQQAMARALLDQGQAQGLSLSDREAALTAQLLAAQEELARRAPLMSERELSAWKALPDLAPTAEEKAHMRRARWQVGRWGRLLGKAAMKWLGVVAIGGIVVGASYGLRALGMTDENYALCALVMAPLSGVSITALLLLGMIDLVSILDRDTSRLDARRVQGYRARLAQVSLGHLEQIHAMLHRSAGSLPESKLLLGAIHAEIAARRPREVA